jgi:hypothetical protein
LVNKLSVMNISNKESSEYMELVTLLAFFENIARKDIILMKKIRKSGLFKLKTDRYIFTLPNLHIFLQDNYEELADIDYKLLRKLIYRNPINMIIKTFDAEVVLENNLSKVNDSQYALVWRNKTLQE